MANLLLASVGAKLLGRREKNWSERGILPQLRSCWGIEEGRRRVNEWCVQCGWEEGNTATTYQEAAEELANCIRIQGPYNINWGAVLNGLWVCREGIGGCGAIAVGLKKLSVNFPWRWTSRNRSSMTDTLAEHFCLFTVLRGIRYVC